MEANLRYYTIKVVNLKVKKKTQAYSLFLISAKTALSISTWYYLNLKNNKNEVLHATINDNCIFNKFKKFASQKKYILPIKATAFFFVICNVELLC